MILLLIDGEVLGVFESMFDCWQPLEDVYNRLPERYDTPINWVLIRESDGSRIDSRGEYEGEYQHPEGLPAGLWFALAEDPHSFISYFQDVVGWSGGTLHRVL